MLKPVMQCSARQMRTSAGQCNAVVPHLVLVLLNDEVLESRHITLSWTPEASRKPRLPVGIGPHIPQFTDELNLLGEPGIQSRRPDLGQMRTQAAVNARAIEAYKQAQVDAGPGRTPS